MVFNFLTLRPERWCHSFDPKKWGSSWKFEKMVDDPSKALHMRLQVKFEPNRPSSLGCRGRVAAIFPHTL